MNRDDYLYGTDSEEHIVGLHPFGQNQIRLYKREGGELTTKRVDFAPSVYVSSDALDDVLDAYVPAETTHLSGPGRRNVRLKMMDFGQFHSIRSWLRENLSEEDYYVENSLTTAYLQSTGKTLFGGMTLNDVYRMQVDIEVISSSGQFPNAERPGDEVMIISMTDNQGWEKVLHTGPSEYTSTVLRHLPSEDALIREFIKEIHRRDPDTLEFHNGLGFDLPYLRDRCEYLGINFALGRDGSTPRSWSSSKEFAEAEYDYEQFKIAGRSVIDSFFLAADFDVYARALPNYRLKTLAKFFGFASEDRTYVDGDQITPVWKSDPARLLEYALDDVIETRKLVETLGNSTFELAKILPLDYQDVMTAGTAGSIESLMVRTYFHEGEALPAPSKLGKIKGGFTELFQRGVFEDLAYADVGSMYPTNMLIYKVQPESDSLKIFRPLLKRLKALRNAAKKKMRAMDDCPEKDRLNAKQQAYKILINSFYGALAFSYFIFNDGEEAGKVTRKGRKLLKRMMHEIEAVGGSVVLCDTDGVLFQLPVDDMPDERVDRMIGEYIDGQMPEGVEIDNDGRFDKVFAYKRKNYALVKPDGSLKINGNSLMGRGMEAIFRDYIEDQIEALLDRDVQKAYDLHEQYKEDICDGAGIGRLVKRARVRMSLDEYKEKKVYGDENQLPQYEAAIRAEELHDQPSLKGDVFWYYISGTGDPSPLYENVKLQEEYEAGDENTEHYLSRLDQIADIFRPIVSHPGQVYNMNRPDSRQGDLFSTDPNLTDAAVVSERVRSLPENPSDEEIEPLA